MRGLISFIIFFAILAFLFKGEFIFQEQFDKISKELNEPEHLIGKMVIMRGDTLMITDYSVIEGTYALENGVKIDRVLGDKLLLKTGDDDPYNVHPPDEVDAAEEDWSDDNWDEQEEDDWK